MSNRIRVVPFGAKLLFKGRNSVEERGGINMRESRGMIFTWCGIIMGEYSRAAVAVANSSGVECAAGEAKLGSSWMWRDGGSVSGWRGGGGGGTRTGGES